MQRVSIITVCYNSEKHLEQTIRSVLGQTYEPIEYILVDGASTDGTLGIIARYATAHPNKIRYVSEPDAGIYYAMNKGIAMAIGELIGIINSDDWYEPTAVANVVDAYRQHGAALYHGIQRTYRDEQEVNLIRTSAGQLNATMIEHPTCFVPKALYEQYGVFDTTYRYVADYELMLRLQRSGVEFVALNAVLANFRQGGASHSPKAVWETYRLWEQYGLMTRRQRLSLTFRGKFNLYTGRRQAT